MNDYELMDCVTKFSILTRVLHDLEENMAQELGLYGCLGIHEEISALYSQGKLSNSPLAREWEETMEAYLDVKNLLDHL